MKRILSVLILSCLLFTMLTGCGSDGGNIGRAVNKFKEFEEAYNAAAPFVVKLDDASVEQYEKASALYRKVATACDNDFEGYEEEDVEKLIEQMDTQIGVLKSLMYKPADETKETDKTKKTYKVRVRNSTEMPLYSVVLKSGSGAYDVTVSLDGVFGKGNTLTVELQAPQNEKFTVISADEDEKTITFGGDFYLRDNVLIELMYEEEKYVLKAVTEAEQEKPKEETKEETEKE